MTVLPELYQNPPENMVDKRNSCLHGTWQLPMAQIPSFYFGLFGCTSKSNSLLELTTFISQ